MKIKELFTNETKWTQGAFSRTKNGRLSFANNPNAACFCLSGAVFKCYEAKDHGTIEEKIRKEIGTNIVTWNDAPNRTFEEVKALVEKLDI